MALGVFKKFARGLTRTRENLAATLQSVSGGGPVDEDALDDLEASLLAADLGPELTEEVMGAVRRRVAGGASGSDGLADAVREALRPVLPLAPATAPESRGKPHVVFVVGVNGGGKTTTVGKLAQREREAGRRAMVVSPLRSVHISGSRARSPAWISRQGNALATFLTRYSSRRGVKGGVMNASAPPPA